MFLLPELIWLITSAMTSGWQIGVLVAVGVRAVDDDIGQQLGLGHGILASVTETVSEFYGCYRRATRIRPRVALWDGTTADAAVAVNPQKTVWAAGRENRVDDRRSPSVCCS